MAYQNGNGGAKQPFKHKTNRGSLLDNDHKTKETQPDFTGSIDIEGQIYWISAWKDMTQTGKKKLSLSVKLQEERQAEQKPAPATRKPAGW
jgi:hypothetical protein